MLKKLNFKDLDKKTKLYLGIAIGMILFIIFLLIILKLTVKRTIGSKQFEARVKNATQEYYKKYPDKLPDSNNSRITISIDELVNEGFLKNPEKLLKKGLTCKGKVSVSNNNGFYIYQPIIECSDDYKTKLLYQKILEDNPIKTSGNGLYQVNDYYLFRGELVNNFVSFADKKWILSHLEILNKMYQISTGFQLKRSALILLKNCLRNQMIVIFARKGVRRNTGWSGKTG